MKSTKLIQPFPFVLAALIAISAISTAAVAGSSLGNGQIENAEICDAVPGEDGSPKCRQFRDALRTLDFAKLRELLVANFQLQRDFFEAGREVGPVPEHEIERLWNELDVNPMRFILQGLVRDRRYFNPSTTKALLLQLIDLRANGDMASSRMLNMIIDLLEERNGQNQVNLAASLVLFFLANHFSISQ